MPTFAGAEDFQHDREARIGVMLVNLGTPDEASVSSVRRYLDEFLSDPRVVEFPRLPWWLVISHRQCHVKTFRKMLIELFLQG